MQQKACFQSSLATHGDEQIQRKRVNFVILCKQDLELFFKFNQVWEKDTTWLILKNQKFVDSPTNKIPECRILKIGKCVTCSLWSHYKPGRKQLFYILFRSSLVTPQQEKFMVQPTNKKQPTSAQFAFISQAC